MHKSRLPDMYVLDALASDLESLNDLLRMLNSDTELGWHREWGKPFDRTEIVQALLRLVHDDLVRVYLPDAAGTGLLEQASRTAPPSDFSDAWFGLTERGRLVHTNWEPTDTTNTN